MFSAFRILHVNTFSIDKHQHFVDDNWWNDCTTCRSLIRQTC